MNAEAEANDAKLVEGPIGRTLTGLITPIVIGFAFLSTQGAADAFFVSRLGTSPMAALGFNEPVMALVFALLVGFGIGVDSCVSRAVGAGNKGTPLEITAAALQLGLLVVLVLTALGLPYHDAVFGWLLAEGDARTYAGIYFTIFWYGLFFLWIAIVGSAALRGYGDTQTTGIALFLGSIVNIILDPMLIFGIGPFPKLGFAGAAWATVFGNLSAAAVVIYRLHQRKLLRLAPHRRASPHILPILRVSFPAMMTEGVSPIAAALVTAIVASYGTVAVAAFAIGKTVERVVLLVPTSIAAGLTPFIGQNWGAHARDRVERGLVLMQRTAFLWGITFAGILTLIAPWIARLFAKDPAVAERITLFLRVAPWGYCLVGVIMVTGAAFNAIDRALRATMVAGVYSLGLAVPFALLLGGVFGVGGVYGGEAMATLPAALLALWWARREGLKISRLREVVDREPLVGDASPAVE